MKRKLINTNCSNQKPIVFKDSFSSSKLLKEKNYYQSKQIESFNKKKLSGKAYYSALRLTKSALNDFKENAINEIYAFKVQEYIDKNKKLPSKHWKLNKYKQIKKGYLSNFAKSGYVNLTIFED